MARSEARIYAEIWEDGDFLDLEPTVQRLYTFLLSQPDLAHTGVIALRERRWANKARGLTVASVEADLRVLDDARFVVIDWETEELLVRSFIRRDKVYKQPNVMRAAVDHVPLISSRAILDELAIEVERVAPLEMSDGAREVVAAMSEALVERLGKIPPDRPNRGTSNPSEKGSGKGSEQGTSEGSEKGSQLRPGERGGSKPVQEIEIPPVPRAIPLPAAQASPAAPGAALAVVRPEPRTTDQIVGWWIEHCRERPPGPVVGQLSKQIKKLVDEGIDPAYIRQGIAEWVTKDLNPNQLPNLVNSAMNRQPARQRSVVDDRVVGWNNLFPQAGEVA